MKSIAITGVSRGLGLHLSRLALARGHKVLGIGRSCPEELKIHPGFYFIESDFREPEAVEKLIRALPEVTPSIWILNAATIASDLENKQLDSAKFAEILRINFGFNVELIERLNPALRGREAVICAVASLSGIHPMGFPGVGYPVSKASLIAFMDSRSRTASEQGIRFVTALPGLMEAKARLGKSISYEKAAQKILSCVLQGNQTKVYLPFWKYLVLRLVRLAS